MSDDTAILEHTDCPRCGAPNLGTEVCCFACGARLKALPKRFGSGSAAGPPWPLWIGLLLILIVCGFIGYHALTWLVGYRNEAAWPYWYLPVAGLALAIAGQVAFRESRRRDARSWRLSRAPELPLSQAHTGDAVWTLGKVACDTPVIPSYFPQECAYYHYILREREHGQAGWRITERETKTVDFRLVGEKESVYVPAGCIRVDAPIYVECYLDPGGTMQVKLWAIPIGLPVSLCGRIAGSSRRPRVEHLDADTRAVVTWRAPTDYCAFVAKRARRASLLGWTLTILATLALIAGLVNG
jgi:hypothetical protein